MTSRLRHRKTLAAMTLMLSALVQAQDDADLTALSIEELLDLEVTSVTKRAQPLSEAAAAVFVITNDDLRRSGARSIPEALRMVPGVQVAQSDASKWSVSVRGFASRFANKLLVVVDGRTVYTPGFAGVYWEHLDLVLEDIERIEVIRGPGATLWGANAVNGVINVITKSAGKTLGGLSVAGTGTEERAFGTLRYGAQFAPHTTGRLYLQYKQRDESVTRSGAPGDDDWAVRQGGFRTDTDLAHGDRITLQGDLYNSGLSQKLRLPTTNPPYADVFDDRVQAAGWNLLGRWERPLSVSSNLSLQIYYDHFDRHERAFVWQEYDTFDIDFQHGGDLGERHHLLWGIGYRNVHSEPKDTRTGSLNFDAMTTHLWSGFVQDEIELVEETTWLTLGSKFEHNDFTGFEFQPNLRVLWKFDQRTTLWAAISRAVRTPSIGEHFVSLQTQAVPPNTPPLGLPLPTYAVLTGDKDFQSEELFAYEFGLRFNPRPSLSLDVAAFYNDYKNLRAVEGGSPELSDSGTYFVFRTPFTNEASGQVYGIELAAEWLVRDGWRLALAYSYAQMRWHAPEDSIDLTNDALEDNLPTQQLSVRSLMSLGSDIDLDLWLRYVDESNVIRSDTLTNAWIDAYWDLDVRLAWRPSKGIELSLVGQNLVDDSRPEVSQEVFSPTDNLVQRGVYGSVKLEF